MSITLKELRDFIQTIPYEMDNFSIVNGEIGQLNTEDDNSLTYRVDKPIITLYVDRESQEVCFLHQTQEDVNNIFPNHNQNGNTEGTE